MLNESIGRRVAGGAGKVGLILCGFGIMTALVFSVDVSALWRDLMMVGFGLTFILALHAVVIAIDGMSWRTLLPERDAATFPLLVWARWVRESTNLLLPVAQVGGEVAGVRLLTLNGVSLRIASASVILDKLSEGMSQLIFAMLGLGILIAAHGTSDLALGIASALAIISIAIIGIVAVQRAGGFAGVERWLFSVCTRIHPNARDALASVVETIRSTGRVRPFALSVSQHLTAWCIGSGETWLALRFMGHPISVPTALAIESLGSVITAAGFIVPGAIGVQESGYMAIGAALGLPAELGLAMSLVKRARQILLGLPALASWQAAELGWLGPRRRRMRTAKSGGIPSSASGSYVRRLVRVPLRLVAESGLTPNHLTTLRI